MHDWMIRSSPHIVLGSQYMRGICVRLPHCFEYLLNSDDSMDKAFKKMSILNDKKRNRKMLHLILNTDTSLLHSAFTLLLNQFLQINFHRFIYLHEGKYVTFFGTTQISAFSAFIPFIC